MVISPFPLNSASPIVDKLKFPMLGKVATLTVPIVAMLKFPASGRVATLLGLVMNSPMYPLTNPESSAFKLTLTALMVAVSPPTVGIAVALTVPVMLLFSVTSLIAVIVTSGSRRPSLMAMAMSSASGMTA